jgi:hypothetical protein
MLLQEHATQWQPQKTSTFHLVVEASRLPMYWLHLEIATSVTLEMLDGFLRDIWLECCGHLSAFQMGNIHYCMDEGLFYPHGWNERKQSMQVPLGNVLHPGQICTYEYDFGSTTELTLKVIAAREEETQETAIRILARNTLPPEPCDLCGKPTVSVCRHCLSEDDEKGYLCVTCTETHACHKEHLLPLRLVNSPRAGVCGYNGPTNPMYL